MGSAPHTGTPDRLRGERQLHRVAGGLAAVGALLLLPLQALLPVPQQPGDVASYFAASLDAPVQELYLGMSVAMLLFAAGTAGIAASLLAGPARGWATTAMVMAGLGGAIAVLLAAIGGVAFPAVGQAWEASGRDAASLAVAEGVWWVGRAAFVAFALTLYATVVTLGLALTGDGRTPAWLGWAGACIGIAGMILALVMGHRGPTGIVDYALFPAATVAVLLWITGVGVVTWRHGDRLDRADESVEPTSGRVAPQSGSRL